MISVAERDAPETRARRRSVARRPPRIAITAAEEAPGRRLDAALRTLVDLALGNLPRPLDLGGENRLCVSDPPASPGRRRP